ncbi:UBAP1-MVB12-associated (UMA)-domain containing protein 1 [Scleropages formosus]|uniref:UBAP1-MVB12-associated (UMA) domain containing 1 n=1 Tax=Scleropages formosus TaxID=113540 RepID=A0A8C9RTU6_SCLFO|nr:UBAP1-MVB12-associated (UMA)-domain containing protein 1 [Scleropages formosus]
MFNFFGRKDSSKKLPSEKETDGFVIIGETSEDRKQKIQKTNVIQPATHVIVQPSKMPFENPARSVDPGQMAPVPAVPAQATPVQSGLGAEGGPTLTDLLSDVPFTLAPHVLAMQMAPPVPDVLLSRDISDNLASFRYDFTLENSVLCDS